MPLTITEGTQTDVYSIANGGTEIPIVKLDIGAGSAVSDFGGTLPEITNIVGGTLFAGTVDTLDVGRRHADEFATVISTGTSTLGTIRAGVSGSQIFITDIIVSAGTATDVEIGDGGTANPIIGTLHFGDDGGMVAPNFKVYPRTTAGSALVYKQSANVPLTITCNGYVD